MKLFEQHHVAIALFAAFLAALVITFPADARDNRNSFPHEAPGGQWQTTTTTTYYNDPGTTTTTYYNNAPTIIPGHNQIVIDQGDRTVIRNYMGRHYVVNCPAGETISPNGCVPISKMRQTTRVTTTTYVVGQPLAETVVYTDVPPSLVTQLQPVPADYEYVVIDGDVVLISRNDRRVIDAVPWTPLAIQ